MGIPSIVAERWVLAQKLGFEAFLPKRAFLDQNIEIKGILPYRILGETLRPRGNWP